MELGRSMMSAGAGAARATGGAQHVALHGIAREHHVERLLAHDHAALRNGKPFGGALGIRQTDTPQRSARSTPKPMIRRVNTSITTMTQWLRRSIDSQRNRSTLHRLSFTCPIKLSQDGPSVPASGR